MTKEQVAVFPFASLALYMTVSKPSGRQAPGLKLEVMTGVEQLSVAVGGVH